MNMLEDDSNENPEEESQSDSDEMMETESQRRLRYLNSEMCECSDPEEWMVYHHGDADSDSTSSWSGHHHLEFRLESCRSDPFGFCLPETMQVGHSTSPAPAAIHLAVYISLESL